MFLKNIAKPKFPCMNCSIFSGNVLTVAIYNALLWERLMDLMGFIKKTREEKQIETNYECEGFAGKYEMEVHDGYYFCRAGINIASVLLDGPISACPNIDSRYSQGNIYKNNFLDIWNNHFKIMRQRDWMKTGICEHCEVFKWCDGNGMHLRDFDTKKVLCCQYNMLNN
jgi:radical SAM protein with 4Fe4S-binding SPASM domain